MARRSIWTLEYHGIAWPQFVFLVVFLLACVVIGFIAVGYTANAGRGNELFLPWDSHLLFTLLLPPLELAFGSVEIHRQINA